MKKEYRIKKSEEIEKILKEHNVAASKNFVLYKKKNHDQAHYKCAISVPKKFGDAVYRNKIKRRVRSIIQEKNISNDFDFFLVIKASASSLDFEQIKKELDYLFKKTLLEAVNE